MSSGFSLEKPYVLAPLPKPIDRSNGRYVVGEVYGGAPNTKKRKRSELAVGIDGEGVNIYDVSAARLITSYALPPQSSFTCPPTSLRTRISKINIERRTYVSTNGPESEIKLFRESTGPAISTESTSTSCAVKNSSSPIVFLGTTDAKVSDISNTTLDLLAVKKDGEIQCYDGNTLAKKWVSPPTALFRDTATSFSGAEVEFVQISDAYSASQGILKSRQDVFTLFPQDVTKDGFNPEIIVLVTKSLNESPTKMLHVVSLPRRSSASMAGPKISVDSLLAIKLPNESTPAISQRTPSYSVQVSAGILQQLDGQILNTFDLSGAQPKEQTRTKCSGAESFVRLSPTTTMVASGRYVSVYNQKFQSKLATIELDIQSTESLKRKRGSENGINGVTLQSCKLLSYFSKSGIVVAILNNDLVGIQINSQQDQSGKPRAGMRLIDSIGSSSKEQMRLARNVEFSTKKARGIGGSVALDSMLPCSVGLEKPWAVKETSKIDSLFEADQMDELLFDRTMAPYLGVEWNEREDAPKRLEDEFDAVGDTKQRLAPADVDRRWVLYALSKIFAFSATENNDPELSVTFYPPYTFLWILQHGHMTVPNIESALRRGGSSTKSVPAGQLVDVIVVIDPDMDLLHALIANNELSSAELLHALRILMKSLSIIGENPATRQLLLTNGHDVSHDDDTKNGDITGDIDEEIERLTAAAEEDLEAAEYQLGEGSGVRGQALSLTLSKLDKMPSHTVVYGLQTEFTPLEITCLIYLLRYQLATGAWTTRYTDDDADGLVDEEADLPSDTITLIASTLNNCIDAIGAGGWLSGQTRYIDKDPLEAGDCITSLALEVSAALEGAQEAVYLKGSLSEMLRYCEAVRPAADQSSLPIKLLSKPEITALPLGLKAEKQISEQKVGAGGAVYKRTRRDIGNLKSQKVGQYTREKIVI